MERGEVCLEQTVERLYDRGMTPAQIAEVMGVEASWVASVVSAWSGDDAKTVGDQARTSDIE